MKFWEGIINNATLGSSKMPLGSHNLPDFITQDVELDYQSDPEGNFLTLASLGYQYRQAGAKPLDLRLKGQPRADEETLRYASSNATAIFNTLIVEELYPLLTLWLRLCETNALLVAPELIPDLLTIATRRKDLRKSILTVCGKRGEWLCKLNPEWDFSNFTADVDSVWQTGKPDERRELLRELRITTPGRAIELLQATWSSEGANEKAAFLEILRINLSGDDLLWLETLKEKGQKVNNLIQDLLRHIPSSVVVQQYSNVVRDSVTLKTGKALLGMISKTVVDVNENFTFPDFIFKTGIDKLSSNKQVSDSQHILIQLISSVPPSLWNEHFKESNQAVIGLFQKEKKSAIYLPAIALAAIRFKDRQWIKDLLDHGDKELIDSSLVWLISELSENDRGIYGLRFIKQKPAELIQLLMEQGEEWSVELAREVIKFTANEVYTYNRAFYKPAVSLIPVVLATELDSFVPAEEQKKVYWKNQSDELSRLLDIKKQIIQSF